MKESIHNSPPLAPDAHTEFQGQDEESDHLARRVEQPIVALKLDGASREELGPTSVLRRRLEDNKIKTAQKIGELRLAQGKKDHALEVKLHGEIHLLSTEHDALQDELDGLMAEARQKLNLNNQKPDFEEGESTKTDQENLFAMLPPERIIAMRDIVEEVPELYKLYNLYRGIEKNAGREPHRRNLLAHVVLALKKGNKEDNERAELMLYEGDDIEINPKGVSELKPIINSIPNLKALQDRIHHDLIASKKKSGLARIFSGQVAITNIELVTSLVEHLQKQQDRKSKALLRILSYYSQKQKPQ